ncbi:MAG TPA: S16 family serine protease, partial [Thermomicrobiales bacterium]|nr:S16 family serine protease [Thermomicrobiales bacterium]
KDKSLAAHRHGIRRIIAPVDNQRELMKIPENIRNDLEFIFVSNMDQVIAAAIMLDETQVEKLEQVVDGPLPISDRSHVPHPEAAIVADS